MKLKMHGIFKKCLFLLLGSHLSYSQDVQEMFGTSAKTRTEEEILNGRSRLEYRNESIQALKNMQKRITDMEQKIALKEIVDPEIETVRINKGEALKKDLQSLAALIPSPEEFLAMSPQEFIEWDSMTQKKSLEFAGKQLGRAFKRMFQGLKRMQKSDSQNVQPMQDAFAQTRTEEEILRGKSRLEYRNEFIQFLKKLEDQFSQIEQKIAQKEIEDPEIKVLIEELKKDQQSLAALIPSPEEFLAMSPEQFIEWHSVTENKSKELVGKRVTLMFTMMSKGLRSIQKSEETNRMSSE